MKLYLLNHNHSIVRAVNTVTWATRCNEKMRRVDRSNFGDVQVSTVFLGIDHNYSDTGQPILFETMVFGGEFDQYMERYHTWNEAIEGHKKVCDMVYQPPKMFIKQKKSHERSS